VLLKTADLKTAHSSQLTAHSSQLTAHSSQLTAHSSHYTLTKRRRVKGLTPKFPLFNQISFFKQQNVLSNNTLLSRQNTALPKDNKSLSQEFIPKSVGHTAFWGRNSECPLTKVFTCECGYTYKFDGGNRPLA
jgi:hypothetical protein